MNKTEKGATGFFNDLPIRYKLLVVYSTIFTVAIILGSLTIYTFVRQTIQTGIESELRNSTVTLVNMVSTTATASIKNHLRAVAEKNREIVAHFHQRYENGEMTEEEAKHMAADILLSQTIGQTGYIYCIGSQGVLQVHPREPLRGEDISRFEFIREQMKRKEGYLEYEWKNPGELQERPKALYMTYFAPWDWIISVSSYREEFTSLVNVDDFRESIVSIRLGETGYCYVMDSRGNFIIHPQLSGNVYDSTDASGRAFIKEICERKTGKIIYPWQNPGEQAPREKLVIFDYIPDLDWIVASSSYLEEFYAPLHAIQNITIITVVLTLVLVLSLTLWMSGSITRPLRTLMNHFTDGADGSLAARMEIRSHDEMGQLAHYFNDFMTKLEASHNALQAEVAERKRAEEALRESERRLADIIDFLPDATMVIDAEGRVTAWNRAMEAMTEVRAEDMLGKGDHEYSVAFYDERRLILIDLVIHPVDEFLSRYTHLRRQGSTLSGEGHITKLGSGNLYFLGSAAVLHDAAGNIVGAIETVRDITDRKMAEQELQRYQQHLEDLVEQRTAELKESYAKVEEANTRIMDSIEYARTIQRAILPKRDEISRHVVDSFVIWRPKDVIGGDLFWFDAGKEEFLLAVIDCTGHGVPGAIMTMIAAATLDRVVHEVGYADPALVLQKLNVHVQRSLHQQTSKSRSNDGMDIGLCYVSREEGFLTYAGARISLFHSSEDQIIEIKGDRQSIGYKASDVSYTYSSHRISLDSSMTFYMSTDGLTDQVGGSRNLPLGKKRLIEFLAEHHQEPLHRQEALLLEAFESYRGDEVQRDDMMVVGLRIG